MKIELWADFVCPYCMVGKKRLDEALSRFEHSNEVEVICRSFELYPGRSDNSGQSLADVLSEVENMTPEKVRRILHKTVQLGQEVGLTFALDAVKPTNTHDAHRLCHFARTIGHEEDLIHRIYEAYFLQGKVISDPDTLLELAEQAGLDRSAATSVLNDLSAYRAEVTKDQADAYEINFPVVPHFRINGKHHLSAVPSLVDLLDVLRQVASEESLS